MTAANVAGVQYTSDGGQVRPKYVVIRYRNTSIIVVIVATKNTKIIESAIMGINNACKMGDHCQGFFSLLITFYI
jgi:hypothetical protein